VERQIDHYNLDVIIGVGYRVNSKRGTQFRQWATQQFGTTTTSCKNNSTISRLRSFEFAGNKGVIGYYHKLCSKFYSFTDGNKRIGAFLFVWFLEKNKHRFKESGEMKINDNALVALALLVAQSNPADKDLMIKLIINLINDK
jgi:hypothetical protein